VFMRLHRSPISASKLRNELSLFILLAIYNFTVSLLH
jgi:hypothetical protein